MLFCVILSKQKPHETNKIFINTMKNHIKPKEEKVMMQNEYEIKKEMCEIGKRVYNRGMVAANDGNFSVKLNDNEFLCTPAV